MPSASSKMVSWVSGVVVILATLIVITACRAAELRVGGAAVSITPDRPVALNGQMHTRVSQGVEGPVTATALALELREGDRVVDQAVIVSCDLAAIETPIIERVRQQVGDRLPGLDRRKVVLCATHTHTAPVLVEGDYEIPKDGVMQPAEYVDFLVPRIADAVARAWESREPGRVGWGLGHAVLAQNRRSVYADGHAQMYGPTDLPDFRAIEGLQDQGVEVLFFWGADGKLLATAINVACPSQEVEGLSSIHADFWHEVRESLRAQHGPDLFVLGWTGAAGDQSPHLMYRNRAEERMRELRGLTRLQELSRRIVAAWNEAYDGARKDQHTDVILTHKVESIELPARTVTESEAAAARAKIEELSKDPANRRLVVWYGEVLKRFERQQGGDAKPFAMELHAIRLGDIAIATNVFELYTEYGIQIKARSRALQTFLIQLAGPGSYLPTAHAVAGGGYSATVESNLVGPEGGQVLVERSIELVNSLWPAP